MDNDFFPGPRPDASDSDAMTRAAANPPLEAVTDKNTPGNAMPPGTAGGAAVAGGRKAGHSAVPRIATEARLRMMDDWYEDPPEDAIFEDEEADPERTWLDGLPDNEWKVCPGTPPAGLSLTKAKKLVRHITPFKPAKGGRFEARVFRQPGMTRGWRVMVRHIPALDIDNASAYDADAPVSPLADGTVSH